MSQFPSMPLFAGDMLADTEHLTNEEFGVYHRLLYAMWRRNGWVPDDDVDLARICHCGMRAWHRLKPRMMQFLIRNEAGELSQKKLLKIRKLVEQKSAAAQQSARQRWGSETEVSPLNDEVSPTDSYRAVTKRKRNPHLDSGENNDLADADGYANGMHRARDSKTNTKLHPDGCSARLRANKPKKNSMIEEIDRRMAALKEEQHNGDDGYFLLPPESHN